MPAKETTRADVSTPGPAATTGHPNDLGAVLPVTVGIARLLGIYGALAGGLLLAQARINQALAAVARISPMPKMRADIVAWQTEPPTQSRSYVIVVAIVVFAALAHALLVRLLRRWPLAILGLETVVVVAAGWAAFHASSFVGASFLIGLVPMGALLAPFVLPTQEARARTDFDATLAMGLALQSIPLAWGVWITTFTFPVGTVAGAQLAAWSFSFWRTSHRGRQEDEALAGLPFTLLPIVGLLRQPSVGWLVAALVAYGAIRLALDSRTPFTSFLRQSQTRIGDAVVVASFWGTCALLSIPYRFRDLPRLNHNSHETGAYATVNSILHGKLMMADAGLIYGPMRSYALTLYMLVAGVTAEQVRLGQALMNHAVLLVLLALGWRLVDRRRLAMVWYVYLLFVATMLFIWMNYNGGAGMTAFGWADLGRIGLPFLASVGGAASLVGATGGGALDRTGALKLAAWGGLAGMATLWAQEFGVCAVLALACVPVAHFVLTPEPLPVGRRARLAAASVASFVGGSAFVLGLDVAIYALFGRARLFLSTVTDQSAAFTSGSYGSFPFPATEANFLHWNGIAAVSPHLGGTALEFVAPVAVYLFALTGLISRALSSSWRNRDTVTLAIALFGLASFRFALGRSDYLHLVATTLPAVALVPRLAVEAIRATYSAHSATSILRVVSTGACIALAATSLNITGAGLGLSPRLSGLLSGSERPSSGPPYTYPKLPRAGDTKIQPEYVALVEGILANSSPTDKIFQHIGYMDGGEVYFLADRVNPTRYDLLAEFLTTGRQEIAADELEADPPKLVFGDDWGMMNARSIAFLKTRYHSIGKFGSWDLFARND